MNLWTTPPGGRCGTGRGRSSDRKNLVMMKGIDKRALIEGKDAIDRELESKLPYLCREGGYIPGCDHLVPPDVSLENYLYFLDRMKEITLRCH